MKLEKDAMLPCFIIYTNDYPSLPTLMLPSCHSYLDYNKISKESARVQLKSDENLPTTIHEYKVKLIKTSWRINNCVHTSCIWVAFKRHISEKKLKYRLVY